jgi:hypothetical protein
MPVTSRMNHFIKRRSVEARAIRADAAAAATVHAGTGGAPPTTSAPSKRLQRKVTDAKNIDRRARVSHVNDQGQTRCTVIFGNAGRELGG